MYMSIYLEGAGEGRRWGGCGEFPSALVSVVFMMVLGPLMKERKKKQRWKWFEQRKEARVTDSPHNKKI